MSTIFCAILYYKLQFTCSLFFKYKWKDCVLFNLIFFLTATVRRQNVVPNLSFIYFTIHISVPPSFTAKLEKEINICVMSNIK